MAHSTNCKLFQILERNQKRLLLSGKRFLFLLKRQRCRNRDHTNAKEAVAMPRLFSCFSIYRRETKKRTACAFVFASMAKGEGKGELAGEPYFELEYPKDPIRDADGEMLLSIVEKFITQFSELLR